MKPPETEKRYALIHLVRSGKRIAEAAQQLGRSRAWGYRWWQRYAAEHN